MLSGVSSAISFVDPNKTAPYVHQYSFDLQRELGGNLSGSVAYIGSTGRRLTTAGNVNINQLDPKYLRPELVTAMTQNVANPFFGNPNAGSFSTRATLPRNQLLRPFPQFDTINMSESNHGKSQYHAGVIQVKKRMTWWGGSFSYTYSRLWDNQFGQGNYYTSAPGLLNNYTFIEGSRLLQSRRGIRAQPARFAAQGVDDADLPAAVRRGPPVLQRAAGRQRDPRQLDDLGGDPDAERLPDRRQPEHQHQQLHARRQPASEHRRRARTSWSAAASPIACATIRRTTST